MQSRSSQRFIAAVHQSKGGKKCKKRLCYSAAAEGRPQSLGLNTIGLLLRRRKSPRRATRQRWLQTPSRNNFLSYALLTASRPRYKVDECRFYLMAPYPSNFCATLVGELGQCATKQIRKEMLIPINIYKKEKTSLCVQNVSAPPAPRTRGRVAAPLIMAANFQSNMKKRRAREGVLRSRPNLRLLRAGGAAVLSGPEQQSRVPEAAADVRVEPGGGQHADVGQLWIRGQTEVMFSPELHPWNQGCSRVRLFVKPDDSHPPAPLQT